MAVFERPEFAGSRTNHPCWRPRRRAASKIDSSIGREIFADALQIVTSAIWPRNSGPPAAV